ncbi:hypothetical protein KY320_03920, partial [Candidatus Woesearchaeota archaeon]|nr:hypothetical protein [Candidatus Woesearchaeota archaeon]
MRNNKKLLKMTVMICLLILSLELVFSRSNDYYAAAGSFGGNWSNGIDEVDLSPDGGVAWDETDNENQLFTFNFADLAMSGTIDFVYLGLRSNFSNAGAGDDELALKYSLDSGASWLNLDGSSYSGNEVCIQNTALTSAYYPISTSLSWADLNSIYLGVNGVLVGSADNEIAWIDAIWLRVNYTDNNGPNINLMQPAESNWSLTNQITFYYNVTDALSNITNCSLILNKVINMTNDSVNEVIPQNFTVPNMVDKVYNWSINCTDDDLLLNMNSTLQRVLYVDTTAPLIELETPLDDSEWNISHTVVFQYNVSDAMTSVSSCSLVINGNYNGSADTTIDEGATLNFSRILDNGNYSWGVNCTDSNGFTGNSTTYNLSVDINYPIVSSVELADSIALIIGSTTHVVCNATVMHDDGISAINLVNATLFDQSVSS